MKKWIVIGIILLSLIGIIWFLSVRINDLNKSLDIAVNNVKAYSAENSNLKNDNVVFKFRIEDLTHMNDSINQKMIEVSRELNIKDKKLSSLQYQLEHTEKRDTLYLRDTIFKEVGFRLDTCISDYWSRSCIHLQYPNEVGISSEFNNEKYIITSWKKEPIKQRKWFLPRWFTRKQKIVTVDVVDKNPYVTTERQRFIEILE